MEEDEFKFEELSRNILNKLLFRQKDAEGRYNFTVVAEAALLAV